jgi:hypothetical protein
MLFNTSRRISFFCVEIVEGEWEENCCVTQVEVFVSYCAKSEGEWEEKFLYRR